MIRPVLKYCIPIYLCLGYIILAMANRSILSLGALLISPLLAAVIIVPGLFVGMIVSVILRKPHYERKFYWLGQIISIALIGTPITQSILTHNKPNRSMADENIVTIRDLTDTVTRPFVLRAFENLVSKFNSPNDLEINSVIELQDSDGFTVYFTYNLFPAESQEYYSKYEVNNSDAKLIQYNSPLSSQDYLKLSKQIQAEIDTVTKIVKSRENRNN